MGDNDIIIQNVFGYDDTQHRAPLLIEGRKLIHYCSADTAVRIIRNREIWLRNVRVMNDYMEVNHGFNLIRRSLEGPDDTTIESGINAVKRAMDEVFPGAADEAFGLFAEWSTQIQNETYVACLSAHPDTEQAVGRLSMWRNYSSGQAGVGLVLNTGLFGMMTDELGVFSSPVYYLSDTELRDMLVQTAVRVREHRDQLLQAGRSSTIGGYFLLLRTIAHCTKHPGFCEEREWRIFHTLGLDPLKKLRRHTETIAGVPQRILKLDLTDDTFPGLDVANLIQSVIVGPSQYQAVIGQALADELTDKGVIDAHRSITYSPIPLRT
ncbi:DUF2971 domain-containing protein [Rhizobium sp. Leaf341]|uniref:DUF2971 domain-containing protein n=1 Tax=Rhizobium sp. Leaf341 TaxID=1736344 RepID=UPI000713A579|nr:DUF2971 domain-containing protein [Rhizobium sp. Leaf341]KQR75734.1 hypothetical protein ASG03_18865 [Rhizobium sp. Leaf341]